MNLNLCPPSIEIFIPQGDFTPWTIEMRNPDGSPMDLTGYVLHLYLDELEEPPNATTQVADLEGIVTDAVAGVVQFAFSPLLAAIEHGTYFMTLIALVPSPTTATLMRGTLTVVDHACHCLPWSRLEIAMRALSHLGDSTEITSLYPPDGSEQSRLCSQNLDNAIGSMLALHPWSFATRHATLEAVTNTRTDWAYAYELPHKCLRILHVLPQGTLQDLPAQGSVEGRDYTVEVAGDHHGASTPILYTNAPDAFLRYVEHIHSTVDFSPLFAQAVAAHLASMIAGSLQRGESGMKAGAQAMQLADFYFRKAQAADTRTRSMQPNYVVPFLAARL